MNLYKGNIQFVLNLNKHFFILKYCFGIGTVFENKKMNQWIISINSKKRIKMRYQRPEKAFFKKNRKKLITELLPSSVVIINSNDEFPRNGDQNFVFRQNSDMFYLSGLDQEKCVMVMCPEHPDKRMREIVFTVKTDDMMVTWYGHKYTREEVKEISGVETVKWLDDFNALLPDLMANSKNVYLNRNEYPKYSTDVPYKDLRFARQLKDDYPCHNYKRIAPIIRDLRLVKEKDEITLISKSCDITHKAFERVLKFIKPGHKEYEIEAEIIHEFIRNGASGHAYPPIIASGINACVLHYIENDNECLNGDLLLMDFGAEYANYASDCSRTIPVNGKFSKRQSKCYNSVLNVMKSASKLMVPGNTIDNINNEVNKLMEIEMINLGLFSKKDVEEQTGDNSLYFRYFMHGTSHFIGLDVHDSGCKFTELKKGMVVSCEPGLYIKEENMGIRIENDILVDDTPIDLMKNIPIEIDEIESLMKQR